MSEYVIPELWMQCLFTSQRINRFVSVNDDVIRMIGNMLLNHTAKFIRFVIQATYPINFHHFSLILNLNFILANYYSV